jgi:DNA mismatch repair protein MutL
MDELQVTLTKLGVDAGPIGRASVAVSAFPSFLFDRGVEPGEFLLELFDKADARGLAAGKEEALHEVLDMMACKAAIKAGDRMSDTELAELLALRERIERSSNCPHGRPTTIRVPIRELEKRFGRG